MTALNLVQALAQEIRAEVAEYTCIAEYQADKKVTVYEQVMPSDEFADDSYYPCVIISLKDYEDDVAESWADVIISIGVYGGERQDGWRDLFNISETVRQYLNRQEVVGQKFCREYPISYELLDSQPVPFYYGRFGVSFRM